MKRSSTDMYELIHPSTWDADFFPLKEHQLVVCYSEEYARKSSDVIERLVQEERRQTLAGHTIYAGRKFRLAKANLRGDGRLEIHLGPTDYLDYLVTNHNHKLNAELTSRGIAEHGSEDAYLSNALGNLAIVSTLDGKVVLLIRSGNVATFQGYLDLPGGHPEPDRVSVEPLSSHKLALELFEAMIREVIDETNIQRQDIIDIGLLGLIRSLEDGRKPEMIFHVPTNLPSRELMKRYGLGGKEKLESNALVILDPAEARVICSRMTAPTRAAFEIFTNILGKETRNHRKDRPRILEEPSAIIFDFDGVIMDSEKAQVMAWLRALPRHNVQEIYLDMRNIIGWPDEDIVNTLVPDPMAEVRPKVLRAKEEVMQQMYQSGDVELVTGIEAFVRRRSRTHMLAVASNSRSDRVTKMLDQLGLTNYFHSIVTAGGNLPSKPDPAIYLEVLRRLDKHPSECVVVEDSIAGLESARAAGIFTIAITTGLNRQDLSPYADWVADSFEEIERHIIVTRGGV